MMMFMMISGALLPVSAGLDNSSDIEMDPGIRHRIEFGRTELLGGGSYLRMDLEAGSSFMVVWGNRENPAPITLLSRGVDILGLETDENDTVSSRMSKTMIYYRLDGIKEFHDINGNGIHDTGDADASRLTSAEPIEKGCSLRSVWRMEHERPRYENGVLNWKIWFTARNITYRLPEPTTHAETASQSRTGFLDRIRFDINLEVTKKEAELGFESSSLTDDLHAPDESRISEVNSRVKIGQSIKGWDLGQDNRRPALGMTFTLKFLRTVQLTREDRSDIIMDRVHETVLWARAENSTEKDLWKDGMDPRENVDAFISRDGGLYLNRDRREIMRFLWSGTAFDDIARERMGINLQLLRLDVIGPRDRLWSNPLLRGERGIGISITGTFLYNGTASFTHDPELGTSGMVLAKERDQQDDDEGVPSSSDLLLGLNRTEGISLLVLLIAVLLLVIVAVISSLSRRRYANENEELMREEEIFTVRPKKRDWDRLRPK